MKVYIMCIFIIIILEGVEIFLFSKTSGVALGPTHPSN